MLFKEIYTSLHNDCRRLASMAIRTIFDIFIQQKVGDQGNFGKGFENFDFIIPMPASNDNRSIEDDNIVISKVGHGKDVYQ